MGTLLAAATGVVAATVIVMGLISLPIMLRYGYDHKLATGIITASGTMAQLLPPSLVLVVLSDQLGVSVGDLFLGALFPGLILSGLYALYVIFIAIIRPEDAPALPPEARTLQGVGALPQDACGRRPAAPADLCRAGQHLLRHRHAHRSRCGRRDGRLYPGRPQPQPDLEAGQGRGALDRQHHGPGDHDSLLLHLLWPGLRRTWAVRRYVQESA